MAGERITAEELIPEWYNEGDDDLYYTLANFDHGSPEDEEPRYLPGEIPDMEADDIDPEPPETVQEHAEVF